jgi:hypothetical protein
LRRHSLNAPQKIGDVLFLGEHRTKAIELCLEVLDLTAKLGEPASRS